MPKVAFILSVYNKEAWIAQTLKTIKNQSLKDIEVIVWDDGSTDDSMKIVNATKDSRFIIGGTTTNCGIAKAYNAAAKLITAPYVCISSADDLYDVRRAQLTKDYFDKHTEKSMVYGAFIRVTPDGTPIEYKKAIPYNKEKLFEPNNQYIPHGFMSVRKTILDVFPYDENLKYGIDYPWLKKLANNTHDWEWGTIKLTEPNCLGLYRWIKTNTSHEHRDEIWKQDNE